MMRPASLLRTRLLSNLLLRSATSNNSVLPCICSAQSANPSNSLQLNLNIPPNIIVRGFAAKSTADKEGEKEGEPAAPRYFRGKLIEEKKEDPTLFPKMLLSFTGYDEPVLEDYFHFVKKATKMVDVNMTKSFPMPAASETYRAKFETDGGMERTMQYNMKRYKRVVEITELKHDKQDIFLEYIRSRLPGGVQIDIELRRWEELVDPSHPSLRHEQ